MILLAFSIRGSFRFAEPWSQTTATQFTRSGHPAHASKQHQTSKGNSGKDLIGVALSGDFGLFLTFWHVPLEKRRKYGSNKW